MHVCGCKQKIAAVSLQFAATNISHSRFCGSDHQWCPLMYARHRPTPGLVFLTLNLGGMRVSNRSVGCAHASSFRWKDQRVAHFYPMHLSTRELVMKWRRYYVSSFILYWARIFCPGYLNHVYRPSRSAEFVSCESYIGFAQCLLASSWVRLNADVQARGYKSQLCLSVCNHQTVWPTADKTIGTELSVLSFRGCWL